MEQYKVLCTHCGSRYTNKFTGFESQAECKKCKKEMNTRFDFSIKKLTLY